MEQSTSLETVTSLREDQFIRREYDWETRTETHGDQAALGYKQLSALVSHKKEAPAYVTALGYVNCFFAPGNSIKTGSGGALMNRAPSSN